jgi:hypothetical protein
MSTCGTAGGAAGKAAAEAANQASRQRRDDNCLARPVRLGYPSPGKTAAGVCDHGDRAGDKVRDGFARTTATRRNLLSAPSQRNG